MAPAPSLMKKTPGAQAHPNDDLMGQCRYVFITHLDVIGVREVRQLGKDDRHDPASDGPKGPYFRARSLAPSCNGISQLVRRGTMTAKRLAKRPLALPEILAWADAYREA